MGGIDRNSRKKGTKAMVLRQVFLYQTFTDIFVIINSHSNLCDLTGIRGFYDSFL
jgi:hypothetical protein